MSRLLLLMVMGLWLPMSAAQAEQTLELFDAELSQWELWMGVPHTSVEGLPEGTPQNDNFRKGVPMGLGNDPKNVFSMIEEDGEWVLRITGEIYGGLTTLQSFENYHLSVQFRWGDKKWEPRLDKKRDSGLLYHCYGEHGAFANVWKACLEYQVQESDFGDFIPLAGPTVTMRMAKPEGGAKAYSPDAPFQEKTRGYIWAHIEADAPHGEWNTLEIYVLGDDAVHLINGQVTLVLHDAVNQDGEPLNRGQIQIQSEGAMCYYKNMRLTPIDLDGLPSEVAAGFADKPAPADSGKPAE